MTRRNALPTVLLTAVAASWAWFLVDAGPLIAYSDEDGAFETLGAALLLIASLLFVAALVASIARRGRLLRAASYSGLALVLFASFGEEVSWGQRAFGWDTPPALADNVQGETNLHNLSAFDCHSGGCTGLLIQRNAEGDIVIDATRLFPALVMALLLGPPLLARVSSKGRRLLRRLGVPVAPLSLGVVAVVAWVLSLAGYVQYPPSTGQNWAVRELLELQLETLLALFAAAELTRVLRRPRTRRVEPANARTERDRREAYAAERSRA